MKGILYTSLTLMLFFSNYGRSQSYSVIPSHSVTTAAPLNSYVAGTIKFKNISNDSIVLGWRLLTKTVPTGWDYSYCDYTNCYTGSYDQGTMTKLGAGDTAFLKVNAMAPFESWGYFKMKVFDMAFPDVADTLEYWFNGLASVPTKTEPEKLTIYPNPISEGNDLTINNVPGGSKVSIYNSLGKLVYSESNADEKMSIPADWGKGVYFVKITNGSLQETRKLIVK